MSNKIGVTDEFDVRGTDNTSRFLRRVGFCRNGSDYKKQSVDIYNPMLEKCNGNYIKDNVFIVNMKDPYARAIATDAVNRMPLFMQNPEVYIRLSVVFIIMALIDIIAFALIFRTAKVSTSGENYAMTILGIVFGILLALVILCFVVYTVTLNIYQSKMRKCAAKICDHYYFLEKENNAKEELRSKIDTRFFYNSCPKCGTERSGDEENCTNCGCKLWENFDE